MERHDNRGRQSTTCPSRLLCGGASRRPTARQKERRQNNTCRNNENNENQCQQHTRTGNDVPPGLQAASSSPGSTHRHTHTHTHTHTHRDGCEPTRKWRDPTVRVGTHVVEQQADGAHVVPSAVRSRGNCNDGVVGKRPELKVQLLLAEPAPFAPVVKPRVVALHAAQGHSE